PASGGATLSTSGSGIDTLLGVYIGNSVSSLSLVTSNDNQGSSPTSSVSFNTVSNQTYQFAVDGRDGAEGTINLTLRLVPGQLLLSSEPREDFWLPASGQ